MNLLSWIWEGISSVLWRSQEALEFHLKACCSLCSWLKEDCVEFVVKRSSFFTQSFTHSRIYQFLLWVRHCFGSEISTVFCHASEETHAWWQHEKSKEEAIDGVDSLARPMKQRVCLGSKDLGTHGGSRSPLHHGRYHLCLVPTCPLLCDLQHLPGHQAEPAWTWMALATGRLADTLWWWFKCAYVGNLGLLQSPTSVEENMPLVCLETACKIVGACAASQGESPLLSQP